MVNNYHNPVLLYDSVNALVLNPKGIYVDVTYGGGGHSKAILEKLSEKGYLLSFDQDPDSIKNIIPDNRLQFVPYNFRFLSKFLHYYHAFPVDGILADLGVSSFQFDTPERGFSYRYEGPLDMRMNSSKGQTAYDIVNQYSEQRLAALFYEYGELKNGRQLAARIVSGRIEKSIKTTTDLIELLQPLFPVNKANKLFAQLFQALRIEVNEELEALREFLLQTEECICPGGKLVVISYHSLEDRLVKNFMKSGNFEGKVEKDFYGNPQVPFKTDFSKAVVPSESEVTDNPRARSAKLRVATRV